MNLGLGFNISKLQRGVWGEEIKGMNSEHMGMDRELRFFDNYEVQNSFK